MNDPLHIWVTRTAPFNFLTAHRLRGVGHRALAIPALKVGSLGPVRVPSDVDALAFTSLHGLAHHRFDELHACVPVFTVGARTAARARAMGYRDVRSADGAVADLVDLITNQLAPTMRLAHVCALDPAGDLVGSLQDRGYNSRRLIAYQTVDATDDELTRVIEVLPDLDAMMIHSPKAAGRVATLLRRYCPHWSGTVFCISRAAAQPLISNFRISLEIAGPPCERSMLDLLRLYRADRIDAALPANDDAAGAYANVVRLRKRSAKTLESSPEMPPPAA